jgi:predicted RNA-binding protein associated with RNAse of E/G family
MYQEKKVIERKICYDTSIVEHTCRLLRRDLKQLILLHKIERAFTMMVNQREVIIPKGSYTFAYYWENQPYNLYFWKDEKGNNLGSYFNLVKNTTVTDDMVIFEDLIIDMFVFPNGEFFMLDEHELPEPLNEFENGFVREALVQLTSNMEELIQQAKVDSEWLFTKEGGRVW